MPYLAMVDAGAGVSVLTNGTQAQECIISVLLCGWLPPLCYTIDPLLFLFLAAVSFPRMKCNAFAPPFNKAANLG